MTEELFVKNQKIILMKSTYQKPIVEILTLRVNRQLMGSVSFGNDYNGEVVLSRRQGIFDDDDASSSGSGSIWDE